MFVDIFSTDKKYEIIYADPPWLYRDKRGGLPGYGACPYSCMTQQDIKELPVSQLAAKDSVLFMWATMPMLQEALDVIKAWGFKYKTVAFVWVKTNPKSGGFVTGLGSWTRSNAELCLIATRGHPKRIARTIKQIIVSPRGRHSEKPKEARERIIQLIGDIPRIELFARQAPSGWDVWGNEAPKE